MRTSTNSALTGTTETGDTNQTMNATTIPLTTPAIIPAPTVPAPVAAVIPAPRRNLWQIADDVNALGELLEEVGGDVTEEDAATAIADWFAEVGGNVDHKIDAYCALHNQFVATADARKAEAQRLMALATTDANNAKRLKAALLDFCQRTGTAKIETLRFKVAVCANGGKAPLILADDIDLESVPAELTKIKVEIDTDAIRTALERMSETNAPGEMTTTELQLGRAAIEIAHIGERGHHLRIR